MEFLTDSLKEVVSKLSENQKEEIDVIESIVNTNETNKENTKEKPFRFIEKRKPENCINFILQCSEHATWIRPKERKSIFCLLTAIINDFHLNFDIAKNYTNLKSMPQVKNVLSVDNETEKYVFDIFEEKTIGRALYEDNVELLQQILTTNRDEGNDQVIYILVIFSRFSLTSKDMKQIELKLQHYLDQLNVSSI